jgi:hypothetical protein
VCCSALYCKFYAAYVGRTAVSHSFFLTALRPIGIP